MAKRTLDLFFALTALALLWPVLLFFFLFIRLDTPGAALFRQQRIGRNGRTFTCYKLRTMIEGTGNRPTHTTQAFSVTRFGRFARRYKLDELPQLFNVAKGDMSLVGPRPCLPSQAALIEERRKRGVFAVRPGITGLAQVQGVDMSDPLRLALIDAAYVDSRTFAKDLRLLAITVFGRGIGIDHVAR